MESIISQKYISVSKQQQTMINARVQPVSFTFVAVAFAIALTGFFAGWYLDLRMQAANLALEEQGYNEEWELVSPTLNLAQKYQNKIDAYLNSAKLVTDEFHAQKWTEALRLIYTSLPAEMEIRRMRVVADREHPLTFHFRVEGAATGAQPRMIADRFLQTWNAELAKEFKVSEPGKFELLDDVPQQPGAAAGSQNATFTITATIELAEPSKPGTK